MKSLNSHSRYLQLNTKSYGVTIISPFICVNILPSPALPTISCLKSLPPLFHQLTISVLSCTHFITLLPRASKIVPGSNPRPGALLSKCVPENIKWGHTPGSRVALLCHQVTGWGSPPPVWSKERQRTDKEPLPSQKICLDFAMKQSQHTHTHTNSSIYTHTLCTVSPRSVLCVLFTEACPAS